jgi:hypothetical protein
MQKIARRKSVRTSPTAFQPIEHAEVDKSTQPHGLLQNDQVAMAFDHFPWR